MKASTSTDEEVLEELGLPLDTHARMLEKSKDVFNTGHYSHSSSYKAEDAKIGRASCRERVLRLV